MFHSTTAPDGQSRCTTRLRADDSKQRPARRTIRLGLIPMVLLLGGFVGVDQFVIPQTSVWADTNSAQPVADQTDEIAGVSTTSDEQGNTAPDQPISADNESRERSVTVGMYLLLLIVITGVTMMLLVLLGGSVVRRNARAEMPRQSKNDPLWFLRGRSPLPTSAIESIRKTDASDGQPEPRSNGGDPTGDDSHGDEPGRNE